MKEFFKMMFASTLGVIIAGVILSILSFMMIVGMAASLGGEPKFLLQKDTVLELNLDGVINDRESTANPFGMLIGGGSTQSYGLNDIVSSIEKSKDNDKIKGIYLKTGSTATGFATLEPIRKALIDFKESGKFIVAYGETISQRSYYVASVADKIFMNPSGTFEFLGLGSSQQYNKNVFEKWGVEMQVFKVGTYKSAVEPYIQDKMSDANREQVTAYLGDIWNHMLTGISESRNISIENLNAYADECLIFSAEERIVETGLIDGLKYGTEVDAYLKELVGQKEDDKLNLASVKDLKTVEDADKKKKPAKEKIAILYAEGDIVGDNQATPFNTSGHITAKQYVDELNKLKDDKNVKAVVFRVNSPGGSAYASEQIWNAVKELKKVKPIVVSMGDYAASGGYYISCVASKIFAEPTTITGSIGIFGLIPSGEQLAKKMGAAYDGVATNKHSLFGGNTLSIPFVGIGLLPARKFNNEESLIMQAYIERGYDLFLSRCAEGRNMTKEAIDHIGQGRVWTGNQALERGLVDAIGGIDDAINAAAELADLGDYKTQEYPVQKDFFTQLLEESKSGMGTRLSKALMGKEAWELNRIKSSWTGYDIRQAVIEEIIY